MARVYFLVSFELPPDADKFDAIEYVAGAVRSSKGQLTGSNYPMALLDSKSVRVQQVKARKESTNAPRKTRKS